MPTTITNQARLQFSFNGTTSTASSNIASTTMQGPLSVNKSALESAYKADGELTYIVNLTNSGAAALTAVTITDDLGTYQVSDTLSVTPLSYIGPAQLHINGVFSTTLTPTPGTGSIAFTIPSLATGVSAMLLYKVRLNPYARLAVGSSIVNSVTVAATGMMEPVSATHTVNAASYADVTILKAMSPNPVTDGSTLTNTFTIQNYGNTAATDVILSDTFAPAPDPITVTVDGVTLAAADYDYVGGTLTLPGAASAYTLTIPAATFVQDGATGEVAINPGTVTIVVAGTI